MHCTEIPPYPSNSVFFSVSQVRDSVLRCHQPDMDSPLWWVAPAAQVSILSFLTRVWVIMCEELDTVPSAPKRWLGLLMYLLRGEVNTKEVKTLTWQKSENIHLQQECFTGMSAVRDSSTLTCFRWQQLYLLFLTQLLFSLSSCLSLCSSLCPCALLLISSLISHYSTSPGLRWVLSNMNGFTVISRAGVSASLPIYFHSCSGYDSKENVNILNGILTAWFRINSDYRVIIIIYIICVNAVMLSNEEACPFFP